MRKKGTEKEYPFDELTKNTVTGSAVRAYELADEVNKEEQQLAKITGVELPPYDVHNLTHLKRPHPNTNVYCLSGNAHRSSATHWTNCPMCLEALKKEKEQCENSQDTTTPKST